ncbi:sugar ABC transporter ATP-binding protein [Pseudonocardia sp. H11422]|uniref:sugar ABC transporter ATP-binding protein n=1 Tax=Pseudonocardia sp. H11422 TaxID=2835866 RepID=UPI001BDCE52F|nr:sugar ABC transporter ATP-binding protein [Pseudonocardia sp. H11422]
MNSPAAVEMHGIEKGFAGTPVLRGVDFTLAPGEVHALAGGNGAGKSTLMKILQGVHSPDAGGIRVGGRKVEFGAPRDAEAAGIGMVFQEFSLVPTLTVARNIFLNHEPRRFGLIDDAAMVRRAREILTAMGVQFDPAAELSSLATGYWQLTEIAKALALDAKVLIMDEPTASLTKTESEALFELIERLKDQGVSIVYISHRMEEIYRICDRITVLRDGGVVLTDDVSALTPEQIVEAIVGRRMENALEWQERDSRPTDGAAPLLEVRNLTAGNGVTDMSLRLHAGEILGLAGLMGSGRTELARLVFGIDRADSGQILLRGEPAGISNPRIAIAKGIALVPEDRRRHGLVLEHAVRDNLLLPALGGLTRGGMVDDKRGDSLAAQLIERLQIKLSSPKRPVRLLSGGNQQKVVIGKWLAREPDVLILDEPTAGVDIGTKTEIIQRIRELADAGKAVIVISSELAELLAVSDRVLVLRRGTVTADLDRRDIADEESLQLAIQGV